MKTHSTSIRIEEVDHTKKDRKKETKDYDQYKLKELEDDDDVEVDDDVADEEEDEDVCVVCCLPLTVQNIDDDNNNYHKYHNNNNNNANKHLNESAWSTGEYNALTTICLGKKQGGERIQDNGQNSTIAAEIIHCDWCHGSFHLACVGLSISSPKGFWKCQFCIIYENNEGKYELKDKHKKKNKNKENGKKNGKDCRSMEIKDEEPSVEYSRSTRDGMIRNKVRVNYEDCASSDSEEEDNDEEGEDD